MIELSKFLSKYKKSLLQLLYIQVKLPKVFY